MGGDDQKEKDGPPQSALEPVEAPPIARPPLVNRLRYAPKPVEEEKKGK